jgi:hypothetical protein
LTHVSEVNHNPSHTHRVSGRKGGIVDGSKEKSKETRQEKGSEERKETLVSIQSRNDYGFFS